MHRTIYLLLNGERSFLRRQKLRVDRKEAAHDWSELPVCPGCACSTVASAATMRDTLWYKGSDLERREMRRRGHRTKIQIPEAHE